MEVGGLVKGCLPVLAGLDNPPTEPRTGASALTSAPNFSSEGGVVQRHPPPLSPNGTPGSSLGPKDGYLSGGIWFLLKND